MGPGGLRRVEANLKSCEAADAHVARSCVQDFEWPLQDNDEDVSGLWDKFPGPNSKPQNREQDPSAVGGVIASKLNPSGKETSLSLLRDRKNPGY